MKDVNTPSKIWYFITLLVLFFPVLSSAADIQIIEYNNSFDEWMLYYYCRTDYYRVLNYCGFAFVNQSSATLLTDMFEDPECIYEIGDWSPIAQAYYRRKSDHKCVGLLLKCSQLDDNGCNRITDYPRFDSVSDYMEDSIYCYTENYDPDNWYTSPNPSACYQQYDGVRVCFPPNAKPNQYCFCTEQDRQANDGYCTRTHFLEMPETPNHLVLYGGGIVLCSQTEVTPPGCERRQCNQSCMDEGFFGGVCCGGNCECQGETTNSNCCTNTQCEQECQNAGFVGGYCGETGSCACEGEKDVSMCASCNECDITSCIQRCIEGGFTDGLCCGGRCECGGTQPTCKSCDGCDTNSCSQRCQQAGFTDGVCCEGECECTGSAPTECGSECDENQQCGDSARTDSSCQHCCIGGECYYYGCNQCEYDCEKNICGQDVRSTYCSYCYQGDRCYYYDCNDCGYDCAQDTCSDDPRAQTNDYCVRDGQCYYYGCEDCQPEQCSTVGRSQCDYCYNGSKCYYYGCGTCDPDSYWTFTQGTPEASCIQIGYPLPPLLPCEYCNTLNVSCPQIQKANETFTLGYTFTSSSRGYNYEVRTLYSGDYVPGEFDQCNYLENVTPECITQLANFTTSCPEGGATELDGETPIAEVNYTVGCSSSAIPFEGACYDPSDTIEPPSCKVQCRYCTQDLNLLFNVSASSTPQLDCDLQLWYNKTEHGWCMIYPTPDDCAPNAYTNISGGAVKPFSSDALSLFGLGGVVSPTQYMWNVRCRGKAGEAFAPQNWTFKSGCRPA